MGGSLPADVSPEDLVVAVERLDDPIVLTGPPAADGRLAIRYVNAAAVRLAGRDAGALVGRPLDETLAALGTHELLDHAGPPRHGRLTIAADPDARPRRQSRREFELTAYPLRDEPETSGYVVLFRDVTDLRRERRTSERDRRRLERLVRERTAKLEEFHERLRRTERLASIGTLGAGLCHDMNNLLMPIRGHLDAIERAGLGDEQAEHLWSVREAIDYLQQLTDGLRLFALDPNDQGAESGTCRIGDWWGQLRPLLARTIPARIAFRVDLDGTLPPVGVAVHRLTQAVLNLLLNAVDAIDGRGEIRLAAAPTDDGRFVRLSVADTGRGMTRNAQQHALDPFFTTKTRSQSTGLGLSLVHGIIHGAGGRVDIVSEIGAGTTVTLNVPAASPEETGANEGATGGGGLAVVTIADERISACFASFLRSAGFAVDANGTQRLEVAAVWVTDASGRALTRARRLGETAPSCRVVAYGQRSDGWDDVGATVIDRRDGLEGIREAIQKLMLLAEPRS